MGASAAVRASSTSLLPTPDGTVWLSIVYAKAMDCQWLQQLMSFCLLRPRRRTSMFKQPTLAASLRDAFLSEPSERRTR